MPPQPVRCPLFACRLVGLSDCSFPFWTCRSCALLRKCGFESRPFRPCFGHACGVVVARRLSPVQKEFYTVVAGSDGGRPAGRPGGCAAHRRCHTCFRFFQMSDRKQGGHRPVPSLTSQTNPVAVVQAHPMPVLAHVRSVPVAPEQQHTDVAQWKSAGFGNQGSQVRILLFVLSDRIRIPELKRKRWPPGWRFFLTNDRFLWLRCWCRPPAKACRVARPIRANHAKCMI